VKKFVNKNLSLFRELLKENLEAEGKKYKAEHKAEMHAALFGGYTVELEGKSEKGQDKVQLALFQILQEESGKILVYDGEEFNAKFLMEKFGPFADKHVGFMIDFRFKQLYSLLPLLSIFEEGGLEAVNDRLDRLFKEYREEGGKLSENEMNEKITELNNILFNAIYLFPHIARSIEVRLAEGKIISADKFWDDHGYDYGKNRRLYDFLKEKKPEMSTVLIMPLPYGFSTGTHGSGQRAARGASREDVYFTYIHPRNNWGIRIPAIAMAIPRPLLFIDHVYFTLEEVESVEFSKNSDLTPFCDETHDNDGLLMIPKANYVFHYLLFRGFSNYVNFRKRADFKKDLSDADWEFMCSNLYEADYGSSLWEEKYATFGNNGLILGFIAVKFEHACDMRLYEFNDIKLPSEDRHDSAGKLFAKILDQDKKTLGAVKTYSGNEVIERLLQIPVRERNF